MVGLWTEAPAARPVDVGGMTRPLAIEELCGDAIGGPRDRIPPGPPRG